MGNQESLIAALALLARNDEQESIAIPNIEMFRFAQHNKMCAAKVAPPHFTFAIPNNGIKIALRFQ
ncbi:MAG: hypothetical protein K2N12_09660 [Helicobacter sp.]|nr:hypothetical protein [Helicobacter sp.]